MVIDEQIEGVVRAVSKFGVLLFDVQNKSEVWRNADKGVVERVRKDLGKGDVVVLMYEGGGKYFYDFKVVQKGVVDVPVDEEVKKGVVHFDEQVMWSAKELRDFRCRACGQLTSLLGSKYVTVEDLFVDAEKIVRFVYKEDKK